MLASHVTNERSHATGDAWGRDSYPALDTPVEYRRDLEQLPGDVV